MDPIQWKGPKLLDPELGDLTRTGDGAGGPSFGRALENALESVAKVQADSDEATRRYALGQEVDLHSVLLQVEKADVSFRTMMEVRNRLLDAYREILRMQV